MPSDRFDLTGIARMVRVTSHLPVRDPGAVRVPLDPNARDRVIASLVARFQPTRAWSHRLRLSRYKRISCSRTSEMDWRFLRVRASSCSTRASSSSTT